MNGVSFPRLQRIDYRFKWVDRKSTRLNSSHRCISYAVFCLKKKKKNIVETAVSAGSVTTLAKALQAAGLVYTLAGNGPFTVVAPTDEAFAQLPVGSTDALLK